MELLGGRSVLFLFRVGLNLFIAMKTFVLTVSKVFPKTHKRAGESTGFVEELTNLFNGKKIHTIRSNYKLWEERAEKINKGEAVLSIRYWSGKPYNSKQVEICRLKKIGVQSIEINNIYQFRIDHGETQWGLHEIAKNDGLDIADFKEWFKEYDPKPMAIIHFTNFRYDS